VAKYCSECSAPLNPGARFCANCGTTIGAAGYEGPASPTPTPTPDFQETTARPRVAPPVTIAAPIAPPDGPRRRRRGTVIALVSGGVVVALIAVLLIILLTSGSKDGTATAATGKSHPSTHKRRATHPTAPTTTTVDPAVIKATQDYTAYVQRLENIVQQSTQGRGQVGAVTSGVEDCTILPNDASEQINSVVGNRTSILNQIAGLGAAPNPEAANLSSLLQQALQSSIQADIHYKGWMDFLYANYYFEYPVGCPRGNAPTDSEYDLARSADTSSSQLKQQFVDAFNPVATGFGLPTWQANSF
jgi:hypothetical protein